MPEPSPIPALADRLAGSGPGGVGPSLAPALDALMGPARAGLSRHEAAIRAAVDSPSAREARAALAGLTR